MFDDIWMVVLPPVDWDMVLQITHHENAFQMKIDGYIHLPIWADNMHGNAIKNKEQQTKKQRGMIQEQIVSYHQIIINT